MACVVVVGAQWGDEGKGKIVDLYTELADVVVRYAGGANAGHTLVVEDEKIVVRLLPSGILREKTQCVLAQGMVVDVEVLLSELDELERRGRSGLEGRVRLSERAHLILPYHRLVDSLREATASRSTQLGTTKKGIGPAYEDKARRTGVRAVDLRDFNRLTARVEQALEAWRPIVQALGGELPQAEAIVEELRQASTRICPMLSDTSRLVDDAIRRGQHVLLEGAQGTLLDLDHGTYPFVTSSSAVAGGATTGVGMGPTRISAVLGITKAYTTRVGAGPFPTELLDADGAHLQEAGAEFGSVTGRRRRTGWLDLPALRYAARVNGFTGLVVTKLDVLTGMSRLKVCVAYDTPEGRTDDFPIDYIGDHLSDIARVKPVWQELPGWRQSLSGARSLDDLPSEAQAYVKFLEEGVGVPLFLVSVGPRRSESIVLRHPFLEDPAAIAVSP